MYQGENNNLSHSIYTDIYNYFFGQHIMAAHPPVKPPFPTADPHLRLAMWMIGKNMPQLVCVHSAIIMQSLMILLSDLMQQTIKVQC